MLKAKRTLKNFLLLGFSFIILLEAASFLIVSRSHLARNFDLDLFYKQTMMSWYGPYLNFSNCDIDESLTPHPYLGFVSNSLEGCKVPITDIGTFGRRQLKTEKEKNEFSILVLGSSQASNLASLEEASPLELKLNARFIPTQGKSYFKIYNGAHPGWKIASSAHNYLALKNYFDAFIIIDGFNEFAGSLWGQTAWEVEPYLYRLSFPLNTESHFLTANRKMVLSVFKHFPFLKNFNFFKLAVVSSLFSENRVLVETKQTISNKSLIGEYKNYIDHLTQSPLKGNYTSHFFQPSALIGKNLTSTEKENCRICTKIFAAKNEEFRLLYRKTILATNYRTHDLSDVFKEIKEDVYFDSVHYKKNAAVEIVAENIIRSIAEDWHLRSKK